MPANRYATFCVPLLKCRAASSDHWNGRTHPHSVQRRHVSVRCAKSLSIPKPPASIPSQGDRLVEIGCIELVNRFPTGKTFHGYFNPERDMPEAAFKMHGLCDRIPQGQAAVCPKADELITFLGDAQLVAHNAMFDLGFLNAELERAGRAGVSRERMIDTLAAGAP